MWLSGTLRQGISERMLHGDFHPRSNAKGQHCQFSWKRLHSPTLAQGSSNYTLYGDLDPVNVILKLSYIIQTLYAHE